MVDRDPVDKWTHGRVTQLGDAAHPMYPRGGNGGAQAILDAEIIARLLDEMDDTIAALQIYENERLAVTNNIIMTNRTQPPDVIIEKVEELTGGEPFEKLEDIIDPAELIAISESYQNTAEYSLEKV
jgi:2-polyprenyl-6-methoxyphenol hydroxylase-like FAD-dependent oxidoreductase